MPERLPIGSFVAVDTETTGLDPKRDSIIELGAVRVVEGEVDEHLSLLVNPGRSISPFIAKLTGITTSMVSGAPSLEGALPRFFEFVGDSPVVAHNLPFDLSFINQGAKELGFQTIGEEGHDTAFLSRLLFPTLKSHSMRNMSKIFKLRSRERHRAEADAYLCAQLFICLQRLLANLEQNNLVSLLSLVADGDKGLAKLLTGSIAVIHTAKPQLPRFRLPPSSVMELDNVLGQRRGKEETFEEFEPLSATEIQEFYSESGPLAAKLGNYEHREEQVQMALGVADAFNGSKFLMVEAGTGVGKSFAYLYPALLWASRNREKIVISTNTKSLQEQLFFKDLPLLEEVVDLPFRAVLLKGRNNYLCLYKLHLVISEGERQLPAVQRLKLMPLVLWADSTRSGDLNECTAVPGRDAWLLSRISCEGSFCLFQSCPYYQKCFLWKIRKSAAKADLVVVNHHLFFSDLKADNTILLDYENVIFDEAHNLEKVAAQYLGEELSFWGVRRVLNSLYERQKLESGLLPFLIQKVNFSPLSRTEKLIFEEKAEKAIEKTTVTLAAFEELHRSFYRLLSPAIGNAINYSFKKRYGEKSTLVCSLKEEASQLLRELESLSSLLHTLLVSFQEYSSDALEGSFELSQLLDAKSVELKGLAATVRHLLFLEGPGSSTPADDNGFVYWAEFPPEGKELDVRLLSAPVEIGGQMQELVYGRIKTGVFTSATLAAGGDFSFMASRLGLNNLPPEKLLTLEVGSPFDYAQQAHLSVPEFLPSPKGESFQEKVSELVEDLALTCAKNCLVLFTSYSMLNSTYRRIRQPLEEAGFTVLAQGISGNAASVLKRIKRDGVTVVLGTESLWEGVDLPGEQLELLIITKLPFAVPSEPLVEAKLERIESRGENPFSSYSVPEAALKLKQGFGRLIRSQRDRGAVVIMDKRTVSTSYGEYFLKSLPLESRVFHSEEQLLSEVREWFFPKPERPRPKTTT